MIPIIMFVLYDPMYVYLCKLHTHTHRLLRIRRQSSISCMNDRDCVADSSLTPPATLVQCFSMSLSSVLHIIIYNNIIYITF